MIRQHWDADVTTMMHDMRLERVCTPNELNSPSNSGL